MLVFCEDCGKRHSVTQGGDEHGCLQFRCDACGFLITVHDVPAGKRQARDPDSSVTLSCSHDVLDFGAVLDDAEPEKNLFLAAQDGRKVELEATVLAALKGNIAVEQVAANVFKVRVVAAAKMAADLLVDFDGPALDFFDGISGALLTVPVVFNRRKPLFVVQPAFIDLGKIGADVLAEGSFTIKNCTAAPLSVTVVPDPHYFSLTSFFNLTSETCLILAASEVRDIPFDFRLSHDASSDEPFEQVVLVSAGDGDVGPPQRVRIRGVLKAASRPDSKDWGAVL